MAKGEKKISISAFEKVMKEHFHSTTVKEWYGLEINIRRNISVKDALEFAQEVAVGCFTADGVFVPEIGDFLIRSNVLRRYANFSLPEKLDKQYELVYGTDAFNVVCDYIDTNQLKSIIEAIDRKIDYMCDSGIVEIRTQLSEMVNSVNLMHSTAGDLVDNLSQEELKNVLNIFKSGSVDEEKIVRAYLDHTKSAANRDDE